MIEDDYKEYGFAVLGPHIDNPDGDRSYNTNPYKGIEKDDAEMMKYFKDFLKNTFWTSFFETFHLGMLYLRGRRCLGGIKRTLIRNRQNDIKTDNRMFVENKRDGIILGCGLHGSYLIFGPPYVETFRGLDPVTFLYGEEWVLYRRCKMNGLITMYDPGIRIWHDEHSVQKMQTEDELKRYLFRLKHERTAYKKILKYIEEERKSGRKFDME